jgi:hypothetical protein
VIYANGRLSFDLLQQRLDDRTVHYRPEVYWQAGTKITVDAKTYGVDLGGGMYGETDRSLNLTIGPAKIATVDDATKIMVTIDGQVVQQIPVSMVATNRSP